MLRLRRTLGQVLFAIGLTLALGGLASFAFSNVELRFLDSLVVDFNARLTWIIVNAIFAGLGLLLWRLR